MSGSSKQGTGGAGTDGDGGTGSWATAAPLPPSPELGANIFSRLFFGWLSPLLWKGRKNPLEHSDLYQLPPSCTAESVRVKFLQEWERELEKPKPSLGKALWRQTGWWRCVLVMFLAVLTGLAPFAGPLLMKRIIHYLSSRESETNGIIYACLFAVIPWLGMIIEANAMRLLVSVGMRLLTATNNAVYRKALTISNEGRQGTTVGEIVQLMSTDAQRMFQFAFVALQAINTPIQIIVAFILLWRELGASVLAGFAVAVLMVPFNAKIAGMLQKLHAVKLMVADERVKMMNEILAGIRVIKFNAYEEPFVQRVGEIRERELTIVHRIAKYTAGMMFVIILSPIFIFLASIFVYAATQGDMSVEKVFVSMALFNLLRMPISGAPMLVVQILMARISLRRLGVFLTKEDADSTRRDPATAPVRPGRGRVYASIKDGVFRWSPQPKSPEETAADAADADAAPGAAEGETATGKGKGQGARKESKKARKRRLAAEAAAAAELAAAEAAAAPPTLTGINLEVCEGELVMVVGPVASGKSSLLAAVTGEIPCLGGEVALYTDSVAYVPQMAWIMNQTLRENILFGQPFDAERYHEAIRVAGLARDIEILPAGDATEIGERGINLSGGQKQRVSIARAVYSQTAMVILDDPLSAIDAEVGKHIFEECVVGVLDGRTRILTTNHLQYLPSADLVISLGSDGSMEEVGTFHELMAANGPFATMFREHMGDEEEHEKQQQREREARNAAALADLEDAEEGEQGGRTGQDGPGTTDAPDDDGKLIEKEDREKGAVSWRVYVAYLGAMGSILFFVAYILMHALAQAAVNGTDTWLSYWSSGRFERETGERWPTHYYLGVLLAITLVSALITLVREIIYVGGTVRAARTLHHRFLSRVLRAPMSFFDTTPLGRIINRFAKDVDVMDVQLPHAVNTYVLVFFLLLGMVVAISIIRWPFAVALLPVSIVYFIIQQYFRTSSLELRRLTSVSRSPVFQHFSETLAGVDTIRAYQHSRVMCAENARRVDHSHEAMLLSEVISFWLQVRLATLGMVLVAVAVLSIVLSRDDIQSGDLDFGLAVMALSYSLAVTNFMRFLVQLATQVEQHMNAIERINRYCHLPEEAPQRIPETAPAAAWPAKGEITFDDVSMRYRPGLPLVLRSLNCTIRSREKIGVVGRTGSGKSSLMSLLFRLVEADSGRMSIDGVDISTIGLADLREHMAIIPQDPVLFAGTVRSNVDPFDRYDDTEVWRVLDMALLRTDIEAMPGQLASSVSEGGANFSVGQRQLICLARALLKKPRILVLDEATASVDFDTDAAIQQTVREAFADCTTLTIAHRLNTIIDSDRIMVLDAGQLVEMDTPSALLANPTGFFSSLVDQTGEHSAAHLRAMAEANVGYLDLLKQAAAHVSPGDTLVDVLSSLSITGLVRESQRAGRAQEPFLQDGTRVFAGAEGAGANVVDSDEYYYGDYDSDHSPSSEYFGEYYSYYSQE